MNAIRALNLTPDQIETVKRMWGSFRNVPTRIVVIDDETTAAAGTPPAAVRGDDAVRRDRSPLRCTACGVNNARRDVPYCSHCLYAE